MAQIPAITSRPDSLASPAVVIADCRLGNIGSVANMVKYVGGAPLVSQDVDAIASAERLILPGVGNFEYGMSQLHTLGLVDAFNAARENGCRILGICLGMQLMTRWSEEGSCEGLGWFDFDTVRFSGHLQSGERLPVPHMGWSEIEVRPGADHFAAVPMPARFYFVHSYFVDGADREGCIATTEYGETRFASAISDGNVLGLQFHPEKSHRFGKAIIRDFLKN